MQFVLETDNFGRLIGTLSDGRGEATVTSASIHPALAGLSSALDDLERTGRGECFWEEGGGEYRWVFARENDKLRMAILWSAGTLTGWENVLWWERPFPDLLNVLRTEIGRHRVLQ